MEISVAFSSLSASIPPVSRCWLSKRDVERLVDYLAVAGTDSQASNGDQSYRAYDGFFSIAILGGDTVRVMLDYRPDQSVSLGLEFRPNHESLRRFRDEWAALLQ